MSAAGPDGFSLPADEPASGGEARVGRLALPVWLRLSFVMPELRLGRLRRRSERFWRTSMRRLEHADSTSALDVFEEAAGEPLEPVGEPDVRECLPVL